MRSTETDHGVDRRTVLKTAGVLTLGGLAGCSGGSGGSGGAGDGGDADSDSGSGGSAGGAAGADASFDGWFDGVANYDGTVVDATDRSEIEVTVGAQGNGGNFAFDPPAIEVSTGTTVVWTWTGAGASHNVVAEDGRFESELVAEEGHTFSHTFEERGTIKYVCTPHRTIGMKGAVVVE